MRRCDDPGRALGVTPLTPAFGDQAVRKIAHRAHYLPGDHAEARADFRVDARIAWLEPIAADGTVLEPAHPDDRAFASWDTGDGAALLRIHGPGTAHHPVRLLCNDW